MQRLISLPMLIGLVFSGLVPLHIAAATPLELAYPIGPSDATDFDPARGEYITPLADFSIDSIGFKGGTFTPNLLGTTITATANIYGATGVVRGPLLASANAIFTDNGANFHDVPLSFSFSSGTNYDLEFVLSIPVNLTLLEPGVTETPVDIGGLVRLLQSESGGTFHSGIYRDLRIDVVSSVPEPSTVSLLALCLSALGVTKFARNRLARPASTAVRCRRLNDTDDAQR
jgi:hypothetical protein